jgi:hypothetical protein
MIADRTPRPQQNPQVGPSTEYSSGTLYKTELIRAEGPGATSATHEGIDDLTPVAAEQLHYRFRATLEQAG